MPILLLDEPTASLDAQNEVAVQKAIGQLVRNKTVVMIVHRLKTIENAEQILVVNEGRIQERGTHPELLGTTTCMPARGICKTARRNDRWDYRKTRRNYLYGYTVCQV